jgi:C-terminal processing protease CtpA/Prc
MPNRSKRICSCAILLFALPIAPAAGSVGDDAPRPRALDTVAIDNLFVAAKVWGYLKYHHPRVAGGCLDWDRELLDHLPDILKAPDRKQGRQVVASWVSDIESLKACAGVSPGEVQMGPPTDWLGDRNLLGGGLVRSLQSVGDYARARQQHYITLLGGIGNPGFEHEPDYAEIDDIGWRYRLLALFRFWNIIEYWYPYRDVIGTDRDDVLRKFIPRVYSAAGKPAYILEMAQLVASVHDGHANLREAIYARPPAGRMLPPFDIRLVEGKPFIWRRFGIKDSADASPAADDGLQLGDVILKVDGRPVDEIFREALPYIGASNDMSARRQIAQFLLHGTIDHVEVEVERDGQIVTVSNRRLPRDALDVGVEVWHDHAGPAFRRLSEDIAYLKISNIRASRVGDYISGAKDTRGLIIDARGYPSEFVVFALGQHLVTAPTPFVRFTHGDLSNPGAFTWTEPLSIHPLPPTYNGKIVILVDDGTMSSAEYHAMAFRAVPNAVVVGSQTGGVDGDVSSIPLPGGLHTLMSGIGVFYPDKTPTQRIGIVPDIEIHPTIAGLREGRDEVLEAALRQILGDEVPENKIRGLASYR